MKVPALLVAIVTTSLAATVPDREGAVRKDRAAMENNARWIFDDVARGFAEAKKTGKPLLAVLRCVPCMACMGLDQAVATENPELAPLHDQFVCVRLINANAIDLARFQFDYDLSFSALFFNADGTVYGRYGSWKHQADPQQKTAAGYKRALEAVLAIHRGYPKNQAALASKQGVAIPFKTPVEIPSLAQRYKVQLDWEGKVVGSCMHCHMVGDAIRASYREKTGRIPSMWIYPQPAPETIGLTLAADEIAHVEKVAPDSIAARGGIRPGDDLVSLAGAPLISVADVSWALHCATDASPLEVTVRRAGGTRDIVATLQLPRGWRAKADISKREGTWGLRRMALNSLRLADLPDGERVQRGLDAKSLALAHDASGYLPAAAKNAGFQKGDILVEIDGNHERATEGEMIGRMIEKHRPGDKVQAVVLRGGQRVELALTVQ